MQRGNRRVGLSGPKQIRLWCKKCKLYTVNKFVRVVDPKKIKDKCPKCGTVVKLKVEKKK